MKFGRIVLGTALVLAVALVVAIAPARITPAFGVGQQYTLAADSDAPGATEGDPAADEQPDPCEANGHSYVYTDKKDGANHVATCEVCGTTVVQGHTWSNCECTKCGATFAAPKITTLQNTAAGVKVAWQKTNGTQKYRVYRKLGSGNWKTLTDTTALSFIDKTAAAGKDYRYTVRSISPAWSAFNGTGKPIRCLKAPAMKNLLHVDAGVKVSWLKTPGAKGYMVYRKAGSGSFVKLGSTHGLSYTDKKAKAGVRYTYTVRSYGGNCASVLKTSGRTIQLIKWNPKWKYAGYSKIHSDMAALYISPAAKRKGIVVAINAGHGTRGGSSVRTLCHPNGTPKVTGGSTAAGSKYATAIADGTTLSGGTSEASATLKVAMVTRGKLLAAGYDVLMLREDGNARFDNIARTVIANRFADCHISIHYDSTSSDKGAFYISVPNVSSYRNMQPVKAHWRQHNALGSNLVKGLRSKGVKIMGGGSMAIDLTQTSYSTIPSVDLEVGDRASSRSASQVNKLANGIVAGVNRYF
ncbi:MAG: N-acetylmuramoyl-L-alanine amidase [Coriobacteriales bacterium]|jgi:N-acetylmuramoyl-L-alanine amidase